MKNRIRTFEELECLCCDDGVHQGEENAESLQEFVADAWEIRRCLVQLDEK